jgi:NAD(P)H-flavin reductase/ferredoxin/fatty-acid desaturase
MAPIASAKRMPTIQIDDRTIHAQPGETILQAALRSGLELPSNCRVGGCGTCKCRLQQGKVKELTETGYVLTAEEIDQGYILACQSVPRSDVRIEVDQGEKASRRKIRGRVVGQEKLTQDITRLTVALEEPLRYRAGQYANLEIDGRSGVVRSYSFATPPGDGHVVFFVRKVQGGQLSSMINDEDLAGRGVQVDGPCGDFWLRPSEAPLLLVAGGSGLAPILAILKEALAANCSRSVTLLFGVRGEKDLYARDEIDAIAQAWRGSFRFVPVLSVAPEGATSRGVSGLVTDQIPALIEPGAHVYLSGPPAMIDGALPHLKAQGVPRDHIHFDRFMTQADDLARAADGADGEGVRYAGALHYLKYFSFHIIGLYSVAGIALGVSSITAATFGMLAFYLLGDALFGEDASSPRFKHPWVLTAQLWLALPLLSLVVFMSVWGVCPGDPLGVGAFLTRVTGHDVLAIRDASSWGDNVTRWLGTGLLIGMLGTITAHELTHRTWDKVSMFIGRWLLAFSFDTAFAIEHVYGHHRYVGTLEDPATAPRGRNVYFHIVSSTIKGNVSAWRIEAERLRKKRLPVFSWHNAFLRGQLMSASLLLGAFAMGGWRAAGFFVLCALWGKALLEIVNYMEHYGVVRNPARPVQPRHSWNTNKRISSWTMFNLTRHSHHHAQGEVPYQDLKPYPAAPMMINGYLATIVLALVPPLWQALMAPRLLAWDRDFASDEERVLAAAANARSGIRALEAHG